MAAPDEKPESPDVHPPDPPKEGKGGVEEEGTLFTFTPSDLDRSPEEETAPKEEASAEDALTLGPSMGSSVASQLRKERDIRGDVTVGKEDQSLKLISGRSQEFRYESVGEIARGGMGAIIKILDQDLRRPVAMKVILGDNDRELVDRFVEEAQITGQLEHPNIVPVHELGLSSEGKVYFTMKLVQGESLEAIIRRLGSLDGETEEAYPLTDLLHIYLKVLDAVAFAHANGVLHRDLKPENIMVGAFGEVLVMDWGLAKVIGREEIPMPGEEKVATVRSQSGEGQTVVGNVIGTPSFMPPEQADGLVDEIDERSDVFALGGVLYAILVGRAPYTGNSRYNLIAKALKVDFQPPREAAPDRTIPGELESVCLKALSAKREDRYAGVEALTRDIRAFLEHRLVSAHRYGPVERFVRFVQRHPAATLTVSIAAFLLVAGAALTGVLVSRIEANAALAQAQEAKRKEADLRAEAEALRAVQETRRADDAEKALGKSRLVSAVLRAASTDLRGVSIRLKESYYSGTSKEQVRAVGDRYWPRVLEFEENVAQDPTSQATWLAIKGWLRRHAGYGDEAFDLFKASREADSEVAYGHLFEGMVWFSDYLLYQRIPAFTAGADVFKFHGIPGETRGQRGLRKRFEEILETVKNIKLWGESSSDDFFEALKGFQGLHRRDLDLAEKGLSKAMSIPEMVWIREEILFARANVRILNYQFDGAISDLDKVLEVNAKSLRIHFFKARGQLCKSLAEGARGEDTRETLRATIETYTRVLELNPELRGAFHPRAMAWNSLGRAEFDLDLDPRPSLEQALADYTEALRRKPRVAFDYNRAVSFNGRAITYGILADYAEKQKKDALPYYRKSLGDYFDTIHSKIHHRWAKGRIMTALAGFLQFRMRHGISPAQAMEGLVKTYQDRAAKNSDMWEAACDLGIVLEFLGRFTEAAEAYETAKEGYTKEYKDKRKDKYYISGGGIQRYGVWIEAVKKKALEPPWMKKAYQADLYAALKDFARARALYEEACVGVQTASAYDDPTRTEFLRGMHYNMACTYALSAVAPDRPADQDPGMLKAIAIAHLAQAIELGWKNVDHIQKDTDLDPIREMPEFRRLVEKIKKK